MSNDFNQTQYQTYAQQYLESNERGDIGGGTPQTRARLLSKFLPQGRAVFEIGSGGGLDSLALQESGFKVTASDFVPAFVDELKKKGLTAILFDAKQDQLPQPFDAVYANAVFVHFSPEEISSFLNKIKPQLQNEKLLFFSVLKGEGQERSARGRGFERDFCYYTLLSITPIWEKAGYSILSSKDDFKKWIQVVAKVK